MYMYTHAAFFFLEYQFVHVHTCCFRISIQSIMYEASYDVYTKHSFKTNLHVHYIYCVYMYTAYYRHSLLHVCYMYINYLIVAELHWHICLRKSWSKEDKLISSTRNLVVLISLSFRSLLPFTWNNQSNTLSRPVSSPKYKCVYICVMVVISRSVTHVCTWIYTCTVGPLCLGHPSGRRKCPDLWGVLISGVVMYTVGCNKHVNVFTV